MRRILCGVVSALSVLAMLASPSQAAAMRNRAPHVSPNLLYIAAGHLWLRPVDGGTARRIATPWPMTVPADSAALDLQWSPDGRRVALNDSGGRLSVVNLVTDRITVLVNRRCPGTCAAAHAWSPNGRYLALVQLVGKGERAVLRVWDSATGRLRSLLTNVPADVASPAWSHDSARIAIEVGPFDITRQVFPEGVTVDLAGHSVRLGKGQDLSWSPDDRLIGAIRPNLCGANTCDVDEIVRSSAGGAPVVLASHTTDLFTTPVWASQGRGYAFDRWLLNASGHPTGRLAGPHERVVSWRPDGSRLAVQTYYPYQGTPDVLYLSTPNHRRRHVYTDGWNAGCGACSKDVYSVSWGRGGLFAFTTPTYPTPKGVIVHSRYFLAPVGGGGPARISLPGSDLTTFLGFVEGDRALIIHAGETIYRYEVLTHRLNRVVTGVPAGYTTAVLDPTAR